MSNDVQSVRCVPFTDEAFRDEALAASGADGDAEPTDQIRYLISYLSNEEARARTLLIEKPYVDRHYMEEYAGYYASLLRSPPVHSTRIHLLDSGISANEFEQWLRDATNGHYDDVQKKLQQAYLGFVVIRPLASSPVGRTVLRTYPGRASRCFEPAFTEHRVHFCGFELRVRGLPFQQQDQAVGACATTAIWSALARVARADGGRTPTPLAVTHAATKHLLSNRAFPAVDGLTLEQMLPAIREFGYSPHLMKPGGAVDTFHLAIKCYLRSGIPVILMLHEDSGGHAITAVGFRERDEEQPAPDIVVKVDEGKPEIRAAGLSRLYVHDDRLGPYARMTLLPPEKGDDAPRLKFEPHTAKIPFGVPFRLFDLSSLAKIWFAIAPLYPKIRLSARELIHLTGELMPLMRPLVRPEERQELRVDLRFVLGGRYLEEIMRREGATADLTAERAVHIATLARFSRYIGVIRFLLGSRPLADAVCDTTDIYRSAPPAAPVLAFIPFRENILEGLRSLAAKCAPGARVL